MAKPAQLRVGKRNRFGIPAPGPLRLRRFSAGLTLAETATAAGISLSRASYVERGVEVHPEDAAALDAAITRLSQETRP